MRACSACSRSPAPPGGVALANALSGALLRDAFAALMVIVAAQLVHKTLRAEPQTPRTPARSAVEFLGAGAAIA